MIHNNATSVLDYFKWIGGIDTLKIFTEKNAFKNVRKN